MLDEVVTVNFNRVPIRRSRIDGIGLTPVQVGFDLTPIGDNRFRTRRSIGNIESQKMGEHLNQIVGIEDGVNGGGGIAGGDGRYRVIHCSRPQPISSFASLSVPIVLDAQVDGNRLGEC
jgi:hypothetical protein